MSARDVMRERRRQRLRARVLAPVGRWTARRKHEVCLAVRSGAAAIDELVAAHAAHKLTAAEITGWLEKLAAGGIEALRAAPPQRSPS